MLEPEQVKRWRRELRAMTRAAAHDAKAFAQVVDILADAKPQMREAVAKLVADGISYESIGKELGIARQTVHKVYGPTRD